MSYLQSEATKKIWTAVAHADYFESECDGFSLEGMDGRDRRSLMSNVKFDPSANLFVTLPTVITNVYVTMSEGPAELIRQVLATIEDHENETCGHLGDVIPFNDPGLRQHGIHAVMLLQGSLFSALDHLPETLVIESKEHHFVSVIFLAKTEYDLWRTDGHDALMDHFQETEKDLISFG